MIGYCEKHAGSYSAARMNARKVQKLAKLDANVCFEAMGLHLEATVCSAIGDYRLPIPLCVRARKLLSLCGLDGSPTEYSVLSTMAEAYYQKSEYAEARKIYMDMENAISDQELPTAHALAILSTTRIDIMIGESTDHILQIVDNAKRIFVAKGSFCNLVMCDIILANLELQRGNAAMAKLLLCQSFKTRCCKRLITASVEELANLNNWGISDIDWVSGWATIFLGYALKYEDKFATHKALCNLGDIFMADGDLNTAFGLFTVALEGFTWMDVHQSRAECMLRLGKISQHRGRLEEAIAFWKAAGPLFERSSQAKDVAHINTLVSSLEQEAEQKHTEHLAHLTTFGAPNTLVQNQIKASVEAVADMKEKSEGSSSVDVISMHTHSSLLLALPGHPPISGLPETAWAFCQSVPTDKRGFYAMKDY
jgi:tetratricopeptide (TPR) repeat protein